MKTFIFSLGAVEKWNVKWLLEEDPSLSVWYSHSNLSPLVTPKHSTNTSFVPNECGTTAFNAVVSIDETSITALEYLSVKLCGVIILALLVPAWASPASATSRIPAVVSVAGTSSPVLLPLRVVIPSSKFISVAVAVTPSKILNSDVVAVTPSSLFNSAVVAVKPSSLSN